ncbi:hypothetical protein GmHk_09G024378 [Glycine max]|nr:hypothetical protein GmHk_09G024378 [Glycine max]
MTRGIANLQCWPKYHYYVTRLRINNEITEDASQSLLNQAEILKLERKMASEAPRWADQWGAGGIGAMEDDDATRSQKDMRKNKNSGGFAKIKSGASICVTWIKNQFKRNNTSK